MFIFLLTIVYCKIYIVNGYLCWKEYNKWKQKEIKTMWSL